MGEAHEPCLKHHCAAPSSQLRHCSPRYFLKQKAHVCKRGDAVGETAVRSTVSPWRFRFGRGVPGADVGGVIRSTISCSSMSKVVVLNKIRNYEQVLSGA